MLNGSGKTHLVFTEAGGTIPANGQWETQAVRSVQPQVEARLAGAFADLDCQTGDVDVRRQLYAALVQTAISMARQRLPENPFLENLVGTFPGVNAVMPVKGATSILSPAGS